MRILLTMLLSLFATALCHAAPPRPNVIFILIDDMGYGDLSCYGNPDVKTPHIDQLAAEGVRFTQFYVASPICSASRVGIMTGQYPARHRINSFLATREAQKKNDSANWLDPDAVLLPKLLHDAGYATAHFGKWHMGGGRDVGDAPTPHAYGFDESLTSFESIGDRLLVRGHRLSEMSEKLGRGEMTWVDKHEKTPIYVDRTIDFIRRHRDEPFYVNLWPGDVHDPFAPPPEVVEKFKDTPYPEYYAVLTELDRQIGRLVAAIDEMGLKDNTLIVLASDNGPTAWPRYYEGGKGEGAAPGYTGDFRGRKWSLYEGGIRSPLIVRWPAPGIGTVQGVDETSVLATVDLLPSLCAIAEVKLPAGYESDGMNAAAALLGRKPLDRNKPLMWEYGRGDWYLRPGLPRDRSPNLAIRDGDWKLLINADGSDAQLYNLANDPAESNNRAAQQPEITQRLKERVLTWRRSLP